MIRFWLATFAIDLKARSMPSPLTVGGGVLAVEVFYDDASGLGVLFSTADDIGNPTWMTCLVGFTNVTAACNKWGDRGFPLIDADIRYDANQHTLEVVSACFLDGSSMHYNETLFKLSGIRFAEGAGGLTASYRQAIESPEAAQPGSQVLSEEVAWQPDRSNVSSLPSSPVSLQVTKVRVPDHPELADGPFTPSEVWSGVVSEPNSGLRLAKIEREPRKSLFGPPAFRFEDVEVLGFRIEAGAVDADLGQRLPELISSLNFHREQSFERKPIPDFRYEAATFTLVIELLRYGRMKARGAQSPLKDTDCQGQHELVVRVLVGQVDDDTAQARNPAVFVPALFVDNAWSKVLGRTMLGYDKRMADFWTGPTGRDRVLPDGRRLASRPDDSTGPVPLGEISRVSLPQRIGGDGPTLLDLNYDSIDHLDFGALDLVDTGLASGASILGGLRWRQTDFDAVEFRRSFASLAIADNLRALRSIQVAPVGDEPPIGKGPGMRNRQTWVPSVFLIDPDIRFGLPIGSASLTLHRSLSAPPLWNTLCDILKEGGNTAELRFNTGGWYRLRCSMDLTVDDGLNWGAARIG